jgi:hypothetical protein
MVEMEGNSHREPVPPGGGIDQGPDVFRVRFDDTEHQLTAEQLTQGIRDGSVPGGASVMNLGALGDEHWHRLDETGLWEQPTQRRTSVPAVSATDLDIVPSSVSMEVCHDAGVDERYLVSMCRTYHLTLRQLHALVELRVCFATNMATLNRLLGQGLAIDEIAELMDARDLLAGVAEGASLTKLTRFYRTFFDATQAPGSYMACLIRDAHAMVNPSEFYLDHTIELICDEADNLGTADLDFVVGQFTAAKGHPEPS